MISQSSTTVRIPIPEERRGCPLEVWDKSMTEPLTIIPRPETDELAFPTDAPDSIRWWWEVELVG